MDKTQDAVTHFTKSPGGKPRSKQLRLSPFEEDRSEIDRELYAAGHRSLDSFFMRSDLVGGFP